MEVRAESQAKARGLGESPYERVDFSGLVLSLALVKFDTPEPRCFCMPKALGIFVRLGTHALGIPFELKAWVSENRVSRIRSHCFNAGL